MLHNVAVVVTQTTMSFYTDGDLDATVALHRPVTDCTGIPLEIGGPALPALGEIVFFPRELSVAEMKELMFFGHSFASIAAGQIAFQPERTELDAFGATQATAFASAQGERAAAASTLAVESAISRLTTEKSNAINVEDVDLLVVPPVPGQLRLSAREHTGACSSAHQVLLGKGLLSSTAK